MLSKRYPDLIYKAPLSNPSSPDFRRIAAIVTGAVNFWLAYSDDVTARQSYVTSRLLALT